jgi:hypothetical protein
MTSLSPIRRHFGRGAGSVPGLRTCFARSAAVVMPGILLTSY